jgi:excisionase family DNA binding protein
MLNFLKSKNAWEVFFLEEKEYLTYEEAMEYLGVKRSTLYSLVAEMDITTHKFKGNKHRYLAFDDVKRIKKKREMRKEKPWIEDID